MHPALHQDNLRNLPTDMRLAANAAISPDRTVADVRGVQRHLANATEKQLTWVLPVFYINLDIVGIPDFDEFDTEAPSPAAVSAITRAFYALEALYAIKVPETAGPHIWARVWTWARFIHFYRAHLPGIPEPDEGEFCLEFLSYTGSLGDHPNTCALIVSTPWFWYMLGRAWIYLPTILAPRKRLLAFNDVRSFIVEERIRDPSNMAALVDGAGGNLYDLAALVVSFIDSVDVGNNAVMDDTYTHFLSSALIFVGFVDSALQNPTESTGALGDFGEALLSQNILRVVIKAVRSLSNGCSAPTLNALYKCFDLLAALFVTSEGYAEIPAAVDEGLLRALIMCAQSSLADDLQDQFKLYFVGLLPSSLVHHRFLSQLTVALHEITDLVNTPAFKRCTTYGLWKEFLSVANERLEVLAAFDSNRASRNTKACDNLQCSKIDVKNSFRRCSGCLSVYYCSQSCQTTDWRHGGHRNACNSYGKLFLSPKNDADSSSRQRSFLRALVHHDYKKAKPILLCKQIFFKHAYPDIGFFTMFDYTEGRVKVQVKSLTIFDATEAFQGVEWKSILSRAAASGGKMGIHVVAIYEAESARRFVIPLRTSTSAVHDRIQHLSTALPELMANWTNFDRESCFAELSPMVTSTEDADAVEVH
ncbi:hypothetical protein C8R45DRAFT_1220653, partial [Mycena sanguinolenta]